MDALPPIPTPPAQRWREFRIKMLPVLVFLITMLAIVLMWRSYLQPTSSVTQVEPVKAHADGAAHAVSELHGRSVQN